MNQPATQRGLLGLHQLPNLICVLRVVVTFVALGILGHIHDTEGKWSIPWVVVIGLAALSDQLDGFLAKRYGWSSALGAFLDQISDKLVTLALYCYLSLVGAFPLWGMALIVFRELFVTCLRIAANLEQISIPTSQAGRFKTYVQQVAVLLIFMHWGWPEPVLAGQALSQCVLWGGLIVFWVGMLARGRGGFRAFLGLYSVPRGEGRRSYADLGVVYATIAAMAVPLHWGGPACVLIITLGTGATYCSAYFFARGQGEGQGRSGLGNLALSVLGAALLSGGLWLALERSPQVLTMWIAIGVLSLLWIGLLTVSYRTRPLPAASAASTGAAPDPPASGSSGSGASPR